MKPQHKRSALQNGFIAPEKWFHKGSAVLVALTLEARRLVGWRMYPATNLRAFVVTHAG